MAPKIALIGCGKTGSFVKELLENKKINHVVFNSKNKPTLNDLKDVDIVISFLTGEVFSEYIDLLLEAKVAVVSGSTGISYDQALNQRIIQNHSKWIVSTNFSLGMNIIHNMITALSDSLGLLDEYHLGIHEIHHTKKLDAPSGTALSWQKWTNQETTITSERLGDEVGFHELTLTTRHEEIKLSHKAKSRMIFAEGAIYSAQHISSLPIGLHFFENFIKDKIKQGLK